MFHCYTQHCVVHVSLLYVNIVGWTGSYIIISCYFPCCPVTPITAWIDCWWSRPEHHWWTAESCWHWWMVCQESSCWLVTVGHHVAEVGVFIYLLHYIVIAKMNVCVFIVQLPTLYPLRYNVLNCYRFCDLHSNHKLTFIVFNLEQVPVDRCNIYCFML